jgi:hypothetical protein
VKRAVPFLKFSYGNTRAVVCVGSLAFKLARSALGARCNQFEAKLYRRSNPKRQASLCPPLWCSPFGVMLVMRRANPMTDDEVRSMSGTPISPGRVGTISGRVTSVYPSNPRRRIGAGSTADL